VIGGVYREPQLGWGVYRYGRCRFRWFSDSGCVRGEECPAAGVSEEPFYGSHRSDFAGDFHEELVVSWNSFSVVYWVGRSVR